MYEPSFIKEFDEACKRMYDGHLTIEKDRVHQEATRDKHHAFSSVDIKKPDPWKNLPGTGIAL